MREGLTLALIAMVCVCIFAWVKFENRLPVPGCEPGMSHCLKKNGTVYDMVR